MGPFTGKLTFIASICLPLLFIGLVAKSQSTKAFDSSLFAAKSISNNDERLKQLLQIERNFNNLTPSQGVKLGQSIVDVANILRVDSSAMDGYFLIADFALQQDNFTLALDSYLKASQNAEAAKNYEKQATAYDEIGFVYRRVDEHFNSSVNLNKALQYFQMALVISQQHNLIQREANTLSGIAIEYDISKKHDTALQMFRHALEISAGLKNGRLKTNLLLNLAISMKNNNELDSSLAVYKQALQIADTIPNIVYKTYLYDNMAILYFKTHNMQESERLALLAIANGFILHDDDVRLDVYNLLINVYQAEGKYKEALSYSTQLTSLKDSVLNSEKTAQLSDAQEKYDSDLKDHQIISQQAEISYNHKLNIILGVGGLALLLVAGFIYYNLRKTAILNKVVSIQRDELSKQSTALSVMMKELHHRVKNNLQIVSSLLNLQSMRLTDQEAISAVQESKQRVQAMSLIHQRLYKTDDITRINMKEYIKDLAEFLAISYGYGSDNFSLSLDIEEEWADIDKALPIGLILNELLTNAFKYAFDGVAKPELIVSFRHGGDNITLVVKDNGKGIEPGRWESKQNTSFGRQLVRALCSQLRAKETLLVDNGNMFTFVIPKAA